MNTTILMLKSKSTGEIFYGFQMNKSNLIHVVEKVAHNDDACLLEYDEQEITNFFELIMFKSNFNMLDYMKKAFIRREM